MSGVKTYRTNKTGNGNESAMKHNTTLSLSISRPTSLGKRGSILVKQKNSLTSFKPLRSDYKLTTTREDLSTTEFSQRKFAIHDTAQKHHSPKALVLVNATQHGMLTTESEMPIHFEEVKGMQIGSKVALNTSSVKSANLLSGPNSTRKVNTPY